MCGQPRYLASARWRPGGIRRSSVSTTTAHGIGGGGVLRNIESRQLPCGAPQLDRPDNRQCGRRSRFHGRVRPRRSEHSRRPTAAESAPTAAATVIPTPDVPVVPAGPRTAEYQTGKAGRLTLGGVYRGRGPERKADKDRLLRPEPLGCDTDRLPSTLPRKRGVAGGPVPGQVWCGDAIAHCPKRFGEWCP